MTEVAKLKEFYPGYTWINPPRFSADDATIVADTDSETFVWNIATGKRTRIPHDAKKKQTTPTSTRGVTVTNYTDFVRLSDGHGWSRDLPHSHVREWAFSPDGTRLVSSQHEGPIVVWNVYSGNQERVIDARDMLSGGVTALAVNNSGTKIASGSWGGKIVVWNVQRKLPSHIIRNRYREKVNLLAFNSSGTKLLSNSDNITASIWDLRSLMREKATATYLSLSQGPTKVPRELRQMITGYAGYEEFCRGMNDGTVKISEVAELASVLRVNFDANDTWQDVCRKIEDKLLRRQAQEETLRERATKRAKMDAEAESQRLKTLRIKQLTEFNRKDKDPSTL